MPVGRLDDRINRSQVTVPIKHSESMRWDSSQANHYFLRPSKVQLADPLTDQGICSNVLNPSV